MIMKIKNKFLLLLGASLLTITTSGCSAFPSFVPPKLKNIELYVNPYKTFVKDDKFEDCAELEIRGYYSNGKVTSIPKSEVELIYIKNDTNVGYNISKTIPASGEYTLRARKDGLYSNNYNFTAVQDHIYATSISLKDHVDELVIAPKSVQTISLEIEPLNYTEQVLFKLDNSSLADIKRINNRTFEIHARKEGGSQLHFFAQIFEQKLIKLIKFDIPLRILNIYPEEILACGPDVIKTNATDQVWVDVYPGTFTTDINVSCSSPNVTLNKISKTGWDITATKAEEIDVTFEALSLNNTYITSTKHITVADTHPSKITIDGPTHVKVGETATYTIGGYPSYFTAETNIFSYDNSIVSINKIDNRTYEVTGLKEGPTDLIFASTDEEGNPVKEGKGISVYNTEYAERIYSDGVDKINVGYKAQLKAVVYPQTFNSDVTVQSLNESIATINRIDKLHYEVTGVAVGEADIKFEAKSGIFSKISTIHHISVLPGVNKTIIKQTFSDFVKTKDWYAPVPSITKNGKSVNILVIPIWFLDSYKFIGGVSLDPKSPDYQENLQIVREKQTNVREDIKKAFFGTNEETNYFSVKTYYEAESFGKMSFSGTVSEWYDCGWKVQAYIANLDLRDLFKNAVSWYFNTHPWDSRKNYDYNSDGYLDDVVLILGAANRKTYDYVENGDMTKVWAAKSSLTDKNQKDINKPGPNMYCWATYDFLYDASEALERAGTPYHYNYINDAYVDSTVLLHEVGHTFGPNDYYDYAGNVDWSGSLNMQTDDKGTHDPYSAMALGWTNPIIPKESCTITIQDYQSSSDVILLTPKWNKYDSPFDEYILIEMVSPAGINYLGYKGASISSLPGIRVWHVNATLFDDTNKVFTNTTEEGNFEAFNNSSKPGSEGGRNCGAYSLNPIYQEYSILHTIRHDENANNSNCIGYYPTTYIKYPDLFHKGDSFDMETYRHQFIDYELKRQKFVSEYIETHNIDEANLDDDMLITINLLADDYITSTSTKLDNGMDLGWTFTIDDIQVIRYNNPADDIYYATITLTKSA